MSQKPSIGRCVRFVVSRLEGERLVVRPATVIETEGELLGGDAMAVDLSVLTHANDSAGESPFKESEINSGIARLYGVRYSATREIGTWHWPDRA